MIYVRITEVAVCALPEDHPAHRHYAVKVEWRGGESHAVTYFGECLGADGSWDYEPMTSNRTDEWLSTHRFDYQTAYKLACDVAPTIVVNGFTVEQALANQRSVVTDGR